MWKSMRKQPTESSEGSLRGLTLIRHLLVLTRLKIKYKISRGQTENLNWTQNFAWI